MGAVSHIDRSSFEPPYAQLACLLRERIASGEYRAGDRLPSEAELCGTYRVSPMTVRRAVTLLVQEEVAITEQGRGTFVKSPELGAATFDLRDLRRYLDAAGSGLKYGRLTLHASAFTEKEAAYLGEQAGTLAWVVEHLFYDFDDRPESWGRFVGRADRLTFSTTVGIPG